MGRRKQKVELVRGTATHRRTEDDYMGVLLNTVSLDDWRDVVSGALQAAKAGDPSARAWLGQYLVGRPGATAPTPLTVVVQQLNGADPVVQKLAQPVIERERFPMLHQDDDWEDAVRAVIAAELAEKIPNSESPQDPATTPDSGELTA